MKIILLAITTLLLSTGTYDHTRKDMQQADKHTNLHYGPNARNRMDVYLPLNRNGHTPMVMLIHGGAWIIGSKAGWPAGLINGLLQKGYAVSCINYRYANGDFRTQMQDVRLAADYLNTHSTEWKTEPGKLGMAGVSAGGHMALLYAGAYDSAHQVKAVVSLAGPTDLSDPMLKQFLNRYCIGFALKRFLGATQKQNPQVYKDASPMYNAPSVPCLFINGQKDDLVPAEQAYRLRDTLKAHHITADTLLLPNTGHYVYGKKNIYEQRITQAINSWMDAYLK